MTALPMTPDEARAELAADDPADVEHMIHAGRRALETVAAMRTEEAYSLVDWEEIDGRYEARRRVRHVTEWRDAG